MKRASVVDDLRDQIVNGLHVGRYRGGERLASVRTLAGEFGVNPRVVLGALRVLSDEGFVELRPRSGAYVVPPRLASSRNVAHLDPWLINMLLQARARGLPPVRVPDYVRRSLQTKRVRAACIECNDDQLHLLCTELADDHGFVTESIRLDELNSATLPPAVRRADVLVTTAYHATPVRQVARAARKPWIAVRLRSDAMRTVGDALKRGPLYYVATDPTFERKLRRMLASVGPVTNLRFILLGRDPLDQIPADASTFIMTSARERLHRRNAVPLPGHPIQPARHFSEESAKELLSFLVRANAPTTTGI